MISVADRSAPSWEVREQGANLFVHCMSLGKVLKLCKSIQLIIRASQAITKIGNIYETPSFKPGTQ